MNKNAGETQFSKVWKKWNEIFQGLEKIPENFPRFGKNDEIFSKPWKNRPQIFQTLEKSPAIFPNIGKLCWLAFWLAVPAVWAGWTTSAATSNLEAVAVANVNNGGIGAGLRVEDAAQGTGTVVAGLAQLSPARAVQPSDRFRIASCSKTFTAAAVFLLKERGLLDFDVAISNYLPHYTIPSNNVITIRHLLTHTSGLPDHNNETPYFDDILQTDRAAYFAPTQILAVVSTMTNNFAPGEKWKYCDTGFYILHLIVEELNTNGWTFPQFVERTFVEPLGLTNTFVPGTNNSFLTDIPGSFIRGYYREPPTNWTDYTVMNQSFDMGCGGMVSSLEDLCKWAKALYGGQVISTNSLAEMLAVTPQSVAAGHAYGLGVAISPVLGYGHGGATSGYFTHFAWEPIRHTAYASFVNAFDMASGDGSLDLATQAKRILGYPDVESAGFSNTIAAVTAAITNLMALHDVPALSIALVDGTNIVWARGFGMANRERVVHTGYDTIYRLASLSKAFAGLASMRLQEEGLIDINADITNTIRNFTVRPRFSNETITVRSLLAHQAGLPDTYLKYAESITQRTDYYANVRASIAEDYLNFEPGFIEKYNNNGPTLIEGVVTGVYTNEGGYRTYAASRLFGPMAMRDTVFTLAGPQTNRLAKVYQGDVLKPDEYVNTFASGGAYSCAKDIARWIQFLLGFGTYNGITVLQSNSVAAVWTEQVAHAILRKDDGYNQFGLGWDQVADPYFAYAGRACWKYGASACYGNIAIVMPERKLGVIVQNSIAGVTRVAEPVARMALRQALLERDGLMWPTNPIVFPDSTPAPLTPGALAGIAGHYSAADGYDLVTGTVEAITWIQGAGDASPVRNEGFVPHADGWFRAAGEPDFQLAFTNVGDRVFMKRRTVYEDSFIRTDMQAERFTPAPMDAVWSNRAAHTWVCTDFEPGNYLWVAGIFPTLTLAATNGVLSVRSFVGAATLQPQSANLAFSFAVSADGWSLQARRTNGYDILRYGGVDFRALDDLPVLQAGQSATGTLAAGGSALYQFAITDPVWHNLHAMPTGLIVRLDAATDLSAPGTYALILQNPGTSAVPYSLRLYNLTSTVARLTTLVTNLMASNNLVGCGLSLVDGTQTVWAAGFGDADRERGIAADKDTVFMIGSCSKTFGALAAMQLVERGLLVLDAPLTNALPSFTIHQRFADNVITPRTILTHHSGLPGDIFNDGFTVRPNYDAPDKLQTILADEYTIMPTNTFWAYNNSGFVMLGQVYRHLTGLDLADYAHTNLFDRMDMTNSSVIYDLPNIQARLSRPYIGGELGPDEYCDLFFAGSIYSTAADMARFMRALLAGGMGDRARVISNTTLAAMSAKQNSDIALDRFNTMLNMGIGFVLDPPSLGYMGKIVWHDGGTVYFRTLVRVAIDAQLGCFISFNTAEAGSANEPIVNSALQWAYEEKTGIAPPAPCDPGTPAPAVAPPDVIALATGGVFVTGSGYDVFATNDTGLIAHLNAHIAGGSSLPLVYRENGWFTPTNAYTPQYAFTQAAGRIVYLMKNFASGVTNMALRGERAADITGFHPAWNTRLGHWWATDIAPDDISWPLPSTMMSAVMIELYARDGLLVVAPLANRATTSFVLSATNDILAFAAGLGRNKGSALRVPGSDDLAFMGIHYRSDAGIPILAPDSSTNGTTVGDEIYWFQIPAPTGHPCTMNLASDYDITAYLYDTNCDYIGQANRAHAFHLDASNACPLMAAIVRDGTNVGPWRLTIHTNDVPFYYPLPANQWPSELIARSNLYGSLEFGHVFAPENRTNVVGNLLKIAVACMKSPNPDAQPIFFCNGGPGDSGIRCAYQYFLKALTNDYDVYLIDQRGVGFSQPNVTYQANEGPADLQYRLAMLQGADLSALNTLESSCDLDVLAAAFALTNANLHGVSYGTLLAQTLMRREPDWLRAVILDGVVAPNIPFISQRGPMRNDALNALFDDIAAHPRASIYYPDFPTTFYALSTNLQNHPVPIQYSGITNEIDGLAYLDAAMLQMTVSDIGIRERIPNIVYRASAGETAAMAELFTGIHADTNVFVPGVSSEAMQMLVFNHDVLPFDSLEAASNACAGLPPILRQLNLNFMQQVVDYASLFDPVGQADPSFTLPVTSAIPTLVINGAYDTQTGTNWAAEVAHHLPNSQLVLVPTVGHGVLFGGDCPLQTIRNFLADPSQDPTPDCLANLALDFPAPWPTNTPWLIEGQTVTNAFASAGEGAWYRFAAVSGLCYVLQADFSAGGSLRIVSTHDASAEEQGRGSWCAPESGEYLAWVIAATSGVSQLTWTYPLLLRDIQSENGGVRLEWQGQTNTQFAVWIATNLLEANAFVATATNLPSAGWITSYTNAFTNSPLFISVRESEK